MTSMKSKLCAFVAAVVTTGATTLATVSVANAHDYGYRGYYAYPGYYRAYPRHHGSYPRNFWQYNGSPYRGYYIPQRGYGHYRYNYGWNYGPRWGYGY